MRLALRTKPSTKTRNVLRAMVRTMSCVALPEREQRAPAHAAVLRFGGCWTRAGRSPRMMSLVSM